MTGNSWVDHPSFDRDTRDPRAGGVSWLPATVATFPFPEAPHNQFTWGRQRGRWSRVVPLDALERIAESFDQLEQRVQLLEQQHLDTRMSAIEQQLLQINQQLTQLNLDGGNY